MLDLDKLTGKLIEVLSKEEADELIMALDDVVYNDVLFDELVGKYNNKYPDSFIGGIVRRK